MLIPGSVVDLFTFPGVIVHSVAQGMCCEWTGTPMLEPDDVAIDGPGRGVIYDRPTSIWKHLLIAVGPFFVNTIIGLVIGIIAWRMKITLDELTWFGGFVIWLAVSIAMHAFPKIPDARSLWYTIWYEPSTLAAKIIGTPLVAVMFVGALSSFIWLDMAYGFAVVVGIPMLFEP